MAHTTRESWLVAAADALAPLLHEAKLQPAPLRLSCGWPARGALSPTKRRIGECWPMDRAQSDGHAHVFVSPYIAEPVEVLGTLLHELVHASLPAKAKHGRTFAKACRVVGLEGKPTETVAGETLVARLNADILPALGEYPHASIDASTRPKQGTRMRLYECECLPDRDAGITSKVRVASDCWDATCNLCNSPFVRQETA